MLLYGGKEMGDFKGGFRGGSRDAQKGGFQRAKQEMTKTKCTKCGADCEVPFVPTEGREVLCKECFAKKKPSFGDKRSSFPSKRPNFANKRPRY